MNNVNPYFDGTPNWNHHRNLLGYKNRLVVFYFYKINTHLRNSHSNTPKVMTSLAG